MIAGYGDVVIGSMTIKKVYYCEGLGHNLFSVGQFCDMGLEVAFRKSTCFVRNEDGVELLIGDHSSNLYTIALNEVASNSLTWFLAKASSSQSWLWHQRLSHLNFATINNLVKNNLVQDKIICDLINTPDLFQEPPQNFPKCGNPVDSQYCQGCALLRKELKEVWFTICEENRIIQGLLDTFESSNDNTNIVNAPQEPFAVYINTPGWDRPTICYNDDDDEDCTIGITPILSTKEPDNSLSMGDEHLDTIMATKSDEVIKSSVENLVPIPNESEGIPDNMCDVPFHDNSPSLDISKDQFEDFFDSNDDSTSIDGDSFSFNDIKYVEASPLDSELISLEVMEIFIPEVGGIDEDILLTIKDDILREKLLNINFLIANIEALKDNPTPSFDFMSKSSSNSLNFLLEETNTFDNSLPKSKTFCFDLEENSSGSTTTRADISLPDYEAFYDDHVKEISSGGTTTHSDFSLYDSFIFDLSIKPFPPVDRSDFYEFADELAHIISLPKYDCFCFKNEPD
nr:integrase, catalytic region, zinc finger, CCHC-type, peptidase aspartic, catalytic [Tanacetum cinerariifolium]